MSQTADRRRRAGVDKLRPQGRDLRVGSCTPNCGACCKFVTLVVHPDYAQEDIRYWLELHGIKVVERSGVVMAYIPTPCSALQPDMTCGVYEQRPEVCRTWPTSQADIDLLHAFTDEGCGYSFTKRRVR